MVNDACIARTVTVVFYTLCSVIQMVFSNCPSPQVYLGNSHNGTKDTVYPQGTVITYSCLIGFNSKDDFTRTRICLIDGTWTGYDGVCKLNVFNFFISLFATVGVILVFILLIACRVSRQRKRTSKSTKPKHKDKGATSSVQLIHKQSTRSNLYEAPTEGQTNHSNSHRQTSNSYGSPNPAFGTEDEMQGPPVAMPDRTTRNPSYQVQFDEKANKLVEPEAGVPGLNVTGSELEVDDAGYKVVAKRHIPYTLANTPSYRKQGTGWIHDDASFDSYDDDDDDGEGKAPVVDVTL